MGGNASEPAAHVLLTADMDGEKARAEPVLLMTEDQDKRAVSSDTPGLHRIVSAEAPRRVVRFPWGDVPAPWVSGYSGIYESCIDDSVFTLIEDIFTSLEEGDDPSWEQAVAGNESQKW